MASIYFSTLAEKAFHHSKCFRRQPFDERQVRKITITDLLIFMSLRNWGISWRIYSFCHQIYLLGHVADTNLFTNCCRHTRRFSYSCKEKCQSLSWWLKSFGTAFTQSQIKTGKFILQFHFCSKTLFLSTFFWILGENSRDHLSCFHHCTRWLRSWDTWLLHQVWTLQISHLRTASKVSPK